MHPVSGGDVLKQREMKTPSTLATLSKTAESIQGSVHLLNAALCGIDPTAHAPKSAMDAGLLRMTNSVGEWTTDVRIQNNALSAKIDGIGSRFEVVDKKIVFFAAETAKAVTQLSGLTEEIQKRDTATLDEIKELLVKNQKQVDDMRVGFASLTQQNKTFREELVRAMELVRAGNEEILLLRKENRNFKRQIEKLTCKAELLVNHQLGLEIAKQDEEEDGLMELLWPQGWDGIRKRDGVRGVLADEPGFRIPQNNLGGKGKPGGGWCTVM
jgi:chromosome segregation ATPase